MKRLFVTVIAFLASLGFAQDYLPVTPQLPLVTVGVENAGSWSPEGDHYGLELSQSSLVKLWIDSPTIDLANRVGDESYSKVPLEASFNFVDETSGNALSAERFGEGPSGWVSFFEGTLPAGKYRLESFVSGTGKNVYGLLLEVNGERVNFKNTQASINAFDDAWRSALSFDLSQHEGQACVYEVYDGDGPDELEARLLYPNGQRVTLEIPDDRSWLQYVLPPLSGMYSLELRQTSHAYQGTNSIRSRVSCIDTSVSVITQPSVSVLSPIHPIEVIVIDTAGNTLNIPFSIEGKLDRLVSLAEDANYRLVEKLIEGGSEVSERQVSFGLEGGRVTYILELPSVAILPTPEVEITPSVPLPLPTIDVLITPTVVAPELSLSRSVSHEGALSCQVTTVTLKVRNTGTVNADYQLLETLPVGAVLISAPTNGGNINGNDLYWQGNLEPNQEISYNYSFEITPTMQASSSFIATLSGLSTALASGPLSNVYDFARLETVASIERIFPEGDLYAGDEAEYLVTFTNPLDVDVTLTLEPSFVRLTLLEAPESVFVAANSSSTVRVRALVEAAGITALQFTPFACDAASVERHPSGNAAIHRENALALAELPEAFYNTTVTVDMAAYQLPVIHGLILVHDLPEGVNYIAGSSFIDGVRTTNPEQAGQTLIFNLPERNIASLSFTVAHSDPNYRSKESDNSLVVLNPEPEVLIGSPDALEFIGAGVSVATQVVVRERTDAVILSPNPNSLIRSGDTTAILVDGPLGEQVQLFVNNEGITGEKIGQKTYDESLSRQSFEYIGIKLKTGLNQVRLVSTDSSGRNLVDRIRIYVAGAPELVTLTPLSELIADSTGTLDFDVKVQDAWGNAPSDGLITFEVKGARPAGKDATDQQAGFQVQLINGKAKLSLEPVQSPGEISISSIIGEELGTQSFNIDSNLRDWIVTGYGSAGAGFSPAEETYFGVESSFFARGRIFDNYLLTLAANYPLEPVGLFGNDPYLTNANSFPLTGSSGSYTQDAYSQDGYYVRLERDQSFLQYSDFATRFEGKFLQLSRAYTGLNGEWNAGGLKVTSYAANASVSDRITDLILPSDGTRVYRLPHSNILANTLKLEVVKGVCQVPESFLTDENDPLLRPLVAGFDYVFDKAGIVRLTFRLPLADNNQNCYSLRANYQLSAGNSTERDWQFGLQANYQLGNTSLSLGSYQENGAADAFSRVVSAGTNTSAGPLTLTTDIAYGENQNASGVAASAQVAYTEGELNTELKYEYQSDGYRSATITQGDNAGQSLDVGASYRLSNELGLASSAQVKQFSSDDSLQFGVNVLANYLTANDLGLGNLFLGRNLSAQFGVQYNLSRQSDASFNLLAGSSLRDIFGFERSELSVVHRQGLIGTGLSSTDFSVGYQILDNLTLRFTDRVVWGQSNSFLLGLEAGFSNNQLLSDLCRLSFCDLSDPAINLGDTRVSGQYEVGNGVGSDAGRFLVGVDTQMPLSDELGLSVGADQIIDLNDATQNTTALSTGATYTTEALQAQVLYDLSFGTNVKHAVFGSSTFAFNNDLYANVRASYLNETNATPSDGFTFSVSGAYRGDTLSILTNQTARFGLYSQSGNPEFEGDTRLNWQLNENWSLRSSYLNTFSDALGYQDLISLGASTELWQGGEIAAYGRLYHSWLEQDFSLGASLELSQNLGCGVNAVGGYNFFDGVDRNHGSVYGNSGAFIRLDFVFDEQWRCGAGSISGTVYALSKQDTVTAFSGAELSLINEQGDLVKTTVSNAEGHYNFGNIMPGRYLVRVKDVFGYNFSFSDTTLAGDLSFNETGLMEVTLGFSENLHARNTLLVPED